MVCLSSCVSLTLSDNGWSVFWCLLYSVTIVVLCSGASSSLSDNI